MDSKNIIQTLRYKTWILFVTLFCLGFGFSAYLLNNMISVRYFIGAELFKTNYSPVGTGPEFIFILISIASVFAALSLTESSRNTSLFRLREKKVDKLSIVTILSIILLLLLSVLNVYFTHETFVIFDSLNDNDTNLRGDYDLYDETYFVFKTRLFSYLLSFIYPWFMISIPFAADGVVKLIRGNIIISNQPRLDRKCFVAFMLLLIVIPMFGSGYIFDMYLIARPISEFVPSLEKIFNVYKPIFSANLYLIILTGVGIYLIHVFSVDRLKNVFLLRITNKNYLFLLAIIGYVILVLNANLLASLREDLIYRDELTLSALRGDEIKSTKPSEKTWVDETIWWSITTLGFIVLSLIAGFITKSIRCVLIGKSRGQKAWSRLD